MKELNDYYEKLHGTTNIDWKDAVVEKAIKDFGLIFPIYQHIDWMYDECIYWLFEKSTRKIQNLSKKMGFKEVPCFCCRMIIKFYKEKDKDLWEYSNAHLFH
jgi:hypothetical protein